MFLPDRLQDEASNLGLPEWNELSGLRLAST